MKNFLSLIFLIVVFTGCAATRTDTQQVIQAAPVAVALPPQTVQPLSEKEAEKTNTVAAESDAQLSPSALRLNELFPFPTLQCAHDARPRKSVRAKHIVIEPTDWKIRKRASLDDWNAAYKKALEARETLVASAQKFAMLHDKLSKDAVSRGLSGGDLGFFARGVMVPQIEWVAFCLPVGELSPVVRSDFGFHIIQVTSVKY